MIYDFLSEIEIDEEIEKKHRYSGFYDSCSYVLEFDYEVKELFIDQEKEISNLTDKFVKSVKKLLESIESDEHIPIVYGKAMSWTPRQDNIDKSSIKFSIKYVMKAKNATKP